jgi:hypothetical protein
MLKRFWQGLLCLGTLKRNRLHKADWREQAQKDLEVTFGFFYLLIQPTLSKATRNCTLLVYPKNLYIHLIGQMSTCQVLNTRARSHLSPQGPLIREG